MFGLGGTELLIVILLAIIFIGPKDLPKVASQIGKLVRQLKNAITDLRTTLDQEIEREDKSYPNSDSKKT